LRQLQQELKSSYGVQAWVIPSDLSASDGAEALFTETERQGLQVDVLVNNAGFGVYGSHAEIPWEREREMLQVDILAVAELTKRYLAGMLERDFGYILLVSSFGAYQPSPTYAAYSAAKSYVLFFGEALNFELRRTGVGVTVVAPGITATEFLQVTGQSPSLFQRLTRMSSPEVARIHPEPVEIQAIGGAGVSQRCPGVRQPSRSAAHVGLDGGKVHDGGAVSVVISWW
jgi:short-subunit dehydrogenase